MNKTGETRRILHAITALSCWDKFPWFIGRQNQRIFKKMFTYSNLRKQTDDCKRAAWIRLADIQSHWLLAYFRIIALAANQQILE